jgi:hypothetical protein
MLTGLAIIHCAAAGAVEDETDEGNDMYTHPQSWAIVKGITALLPTIVSLGAFFFVIAIASAPNSLSSFNMYLIFIILPDAMLNGIVGISLFWEASHEGTYTSAFCKARNSFSFFYYFTNLYMNAVVAREINILVQNSYRRIRTRPPPFRKVAGQIIGVYLLAALLAAWCLLEVRWSPYTITDAVYCNPSTGSPTDDPVFTEWTGTLVGLAMVGPPFIYVFWVGWHVWKSNLLPIKGRTRALSLYFFRIVLVFFCFYIPSISIAFIYFNIPTDYHSIRFWMLWVFTLLIPLQCIVTLKLVMTKDDINKAIRHGSSRFFCFGKSSGLARTSSQEDCWDEEEDVCEEQDHVRAHDVDVDDVDVDVDVEHTTHPNG